MPPRKRARIEAPDSTKASGALQTLSDTISSLEHDLQNEKDAHEKTLTLSRDHKKWRLHYEHQSKACKQQTIALEKELSDRKQQFAKLEEDMKDREAILTAREAEYEEDQNALLESKEQISRLEAELATKDEENEMDRSIALEESEQRVTKLRAGLAAKDEKAAEERTAIEEKYMKLVKAAKGVVGSNVLEVGGKVQALNEAIRELEI